jgi:hypothetical protein
MQGELARMRINFADFEADVRRGLAAKKAEQEAVTHVEGAPAGQWDGADTARHIDNPAAINAARDRQAAVEARGAARAAKRGGAVPEAVGPEADATVPSMAAQENAAIDKSNAPASAAADVTEKIAGDLHAQGVTEATLHVADPITGVTPFQKAMAAHDPQAAIYVEALEKAAKASHAVRERWRVYGRHLRDEAGRSTGRSGPPLNLTLDELTVDSKGRWHAAFKKSNPREKLEILRALGPERGRVLLTWLDDAERTAIL